MVFLKSRDGITYCFDNRSPEIIGYKHYSMFPIRLSTLQMTYKHDFLPQLDLVPLTALSFCSIVFKSSSRHSA